MGADDRDSLSGETRIYNLRAMSLITRCTNCETLFKVVPDQLRISDGWVRCGQCGEVFDATLGLMESAPEVQRDATSADAAPTGALPAPPLAQSAADVPAGNNELARDASTELAATTAAPTVAPAYAAPDVLDIALPGAQEHAQFSFMRKPAGDSVWGRPVVRAVLACASVGLGVLLALQVVHRERDRIAALEPAARPALTALCAVTGCRLAPLRQIESVVIESSAFERVRADNYRLGFSLRNTAAIEVAMPAIELSVTDAQDQTLIRRVFLPAEFAASTPVLGGGADWSSNLVLSVKTGAHSDRVTGYRLLMFYP